jgi:hypothetical protein
MNETNAAHDLLGRELKRVGKLPRRLKNMRLRQVHSSQYATRYKKTRGFVF